MTNPVLQALANARQQEIDEAETAVEAAAATYLGTPPKMPANSHAVVAFLRWCELKGVRHCPAKPATVALFIMDSAAAGIERVWETVAAIASLHNSLGLANPVATWAVAEALKRLSDVEPPRSWPAEEKRRFEQLPYDLQMYVVKREAQRDRIVRRAQNTIAKEQQSEASATG